MGSLPDLVPPLGHLVRKFGGPAPTPSWCYPRHMCQKRHLAHSAHQAPAQSREEVSTWGLHQTCSQPWCTFPESLVELRPLLLGVTPTLFEFSPETEQTF